MSNIFMLYYSFSLRCPTFHKVLDKLSNPIKAEVSLTE